MSSTYWYPHYIGDYNCKTAHLSIVEHGAYRLLLDHYYATGGPLPGNYKQLYRICSAFDEQEQSAVVSVVNEFFIYDGGCYWHDRADNEIQKRQEISEKRAKAAKRKAKSQTCDVSDEQKNNKSSANAEQKQNKSSALTTTATREKKGYSNEYPKKRKSYPDEFERWYATYPHKVGKADAFKAFQNARQKADLDTLIDGVERYKREKPPDVKYCNPATWLNQERWLDQPAEQPHGGQNGTDRRTGYDPNRSVEIALQDQTRRPASERGHGNTSQAFDTGDIRRRSVLDRPSANALPGTPDRG